MYFFAYFEFVSVGNKSGHYVLLKNEVDIMDKFIKIIITISLVALAINSYFIVAYLKNIVELLAGLLNSH